MVLYLSQVKSLIRCTDARLVQPHRTPYCCSHSGDTSFTTSDINTLYERTVPTSKSKLESWWRNTVIHWRACCSKSLRSTTRSSVPSGLVSGRYLRCGTPSRFTLESRACPFVSGVQPLPGERLKCMHVNNSVSPA